MERVYARDRFVRVLKSKVVHIAEMNDDGEWATGKTLCRKNVGKDWNISENDYSDYSVKGSQYKCCITCFRRAYW
jgi:hypothetical protein